MVFGPAGDRRFFGSGGPGGPQNLPESGGLRPPPFGMFFGAAQTPNRRLPAGPKTMY